MPRGRHRSTADVSHGFVHVFQNSSDLKTKFLKVLLL